MLQRKLPGGRSIGAHKAFAQLRQQHLERTPKSVQHANALSQRPHALAPRLRGARLAVLVSSVRLDQERRTPGNVGLQQLDPSSAASQLFTTM